MARIGSVASAPPRAAAAAASSTAAGPAPASAALLAALAAGDQASTMVFSPSTALPRAWMPPSAASTTPAAPPPSRPPAPAAFAPRRNAVPYRGPAAPPTVDIRVLATSFSTSATVCGSWAARASTTAPKPRSRFSPWSPSPIWRSKSINRSRCSPTRSRVRFIHSSAHAAPSSLISSSHRGARRTLCPPRAIGPFRARRFQECARHFRAGAPQPRARAPNTSRRACVASRSAPAFSKQVRVTSRRACARARRKGPAARRRRG